MQQNACIFLLVKQVESLDSSYLSTQPFLLSLFVSLPVLRADCVI